MRYTKKCHLFQHLLLTAVIWKTCCQPYAESYSTVSLIWCWSDISASAPQLRHNESAIMYPWQAMKGVYSVFDHPWVVGIAGGIWGNLGPGWAWVGLPGPAGPGLAQMQRLLSRHGTEISVGPKHTSCYLHVTDSCVWIFIQSAD